MFWGIMLTFLLFVFITISKVFQQGKVGRNLSVSCYSLLLIRSLSY
jgi:hypothetical protein